MINRLRLSIIITAVGFLVFYLLFRQSPSIRRNGSQDLSLVQHVFNRTLGFQKIFAVGLHERTDKHDALSLAASLTGIDLTWSAGVKAEYISPKATPLEWSLKNNNFSPGALGCWRAHMNIMQKIVDGHIESALILEDDADWDVFLKYQLAQFAIGTRSLQRSFEADGSPYGSRWDFLWLGHARLSATNDGQEIYMLRDDPTVPPFAKRHSFWRQTHIPTGLQLNDTRAVVKTDGGIGTVAIAVTLNGARKILSALSLNAPAMPVDSGYNRLCGGILKPQLACYGPWPPLISPHRAAGPRSRDSDISNNSKSWHEEFTWDTVYSTMKNSQRLLSGQWTVLAQWPELVNFPELRLSLVPFAEGQLQPMELGRQEEQYDDKINGNMRPHT